MPYYFVRVAGETSHNNPQEHSSFVAGEPPTYPKKYFNHYARCLADGFIRIGWPDTGDLLKGGKNSALTDAYTLETLKPHIQKYLFQFSNMPLGSIVLMPNKDNPGELYIGEVNAPYRYYHDVPNDPYECSHRVGVSWNKDESGMPKAYLASSLGIGIMGGWWLRAFHEIKDKKTISAIDQAHSEASPSILVDLDSFVQYPYESHSWTHTSRFTAFKTSDKTLSHNAETGIPLDIVDSFFDTELEAGKYLEVSLVVNGQSYLSKIERKNDNRYKLHLNVVKDRLNLNSLDVGKDTLWFEKDPDDLNCFYISTKCSNKSLAVKPKGKFKPSKTTAISKAERRVGQDYFRSEVMEVCKGRCIVTGVREQYPSILIASHIKPWSISNDDERMDGHNGLLLAPHVDKLFDKYLISFDRHGLIIPSKRIDKTIIASWNIDTSSVYKLTAQQNVYLEHHREFMNKLDAKEAELKGQSPFKLKGPEPFNLK
jgi:hypothetical protein